MHYGAVRGRANFPPPARALPRITPPGLAPPRSASRAVHARLGNLGVSLAQPIPARSKGGARRARVAAL
eukprot:3328481-Lingulodinium_polyedra.AAC.1